LASAIECHAGEDRSSNAETCINGFLRAIQTAMKGGKSADDVARWKAADKYKGTLWRTRG